MHATCRFIVAAVAVALAAPAFAQGIVKTSRLSAALAHEAVGEAVAACARNGYAVTAQAATA